VSHKPFECVANEKGLNMQTKNRIHFGRLATNAGGWRRSHHTRILAPSTLCLCHYAMLAFLLLSPQAPLHADDRPEARATEAPEPTEAVMLSGDWVPTDPHRIDYAKLPRVPSEQVVVSDVRAKKGVNQHNYLAFHEGRFFAMWSNGPGVEDRVGQRIRFATSDDGLAWSAPKFLTPEPPGSGPGSPHWKIWSRGGATIHVSDVPPDDPDFAAVQWWGGLGGLHHLEPAPAQPGARGKHIASQYFEAFPGHAAKLEQPLDDDLVERWSAIATENGVPVPKSATTRGESIRAAWNSSQPIPQHRTKPTQEVNQ